jgi:hypothetical protein
VFGIWVLIHIPEYLATRGAVGAGGVLTVGVGAFAFAGWLWKD